MKALFTLLLTITLFTSSANADSFKSEKELRKFSASIMEKVAGGDISAALNAMGPYITVPEAEFQSSVLNSVAQRQQYAQRHGKSIGYEFIREEKAGESLLQYIYIEKTEKQALPWVFYFYKSPTGWMLSGYHWSDQLPLLFNN